MPLGLYPKPESRGAVDRPAIARNDLPTPKAVLRRLSPVVQFAGRHRPDVISQIRQTVERGFTRGLSLAEIAAELGDRSSQLGFTSEIRTQEVRFEDLPSYPGQTVLTGIILVDLTPVAKKETHEKSPA